MDKYGVVMLRKVRNKMVRMFNADNENVCTMKSECAVNG